MAEPMPGTTSSSQSQCVGKEADGSSSTRPRSVDVDISVLGGYQKQLALLERQNKKMLNIEASFVREAQARAKNVHFDKDTIRDSLRQAPSETPPGLRWWPPELRLERSHLCSPCRAIDFEAAFTTPRMYHKSGQRYIRVHEQDTQSFNYNETNSEGIDWPVNLSCQFCRYLANAAHKSPKRGKYTIVFHNEGQSHHDEVFITVVPSSLQDIYQFKSTFGHSPGGSSFGGMRSASNTIICHRNRPVRKAGTPQIVPRVLDASLAKSWFDMCKRKHTVCGVEDDMEMPKTRLIDCITRRLVSVRSDHHPRPNFVALSYVWGAGLNKEPRAVNDNHLMDLPQTIDDAITATKALGFQYLWVDQYCIDQGDTEDKLRQIRHMDIIYKCADLTIIAAAGDGCDYGLPGVSASRRNFLNPFVVDDFFTFGIHPRENYQYWKNGSWHTRGWTFQEALLSRRRLVFSDTAMYYECKGYTDGAWQSELCGGVECSQPEDSDGPGDAGGSHDLKGVGVESVVGSNTLSNPIKLDRYESGPANHKGLFESFLTFISLVTQYTTRNLSYDSDALNAFRGAANALSHIENPVYDIYGIPFVVSDQAGFEDSLVEDSFLCGLAWQSKTGGVRRSPEFPSWSWANVRVWNVTWTRDDHDDGYEQILTKAIYRAHGMHIRVDGDNEPHALAEYAKACRNPALLSQFGGNLTALCFKSRILCSRFTSEYLDHRDDYHLGEAYSDLGYGTKNIRIYVDVVSSCQQSCSTEIYDERLCTDLESQRCSLVLLRFDRDEASALLVEWLEVEPDGHQRLARRAGIFKFDASCGYEEGGPEQTNKLLRCFSIETDLKLF